MARIGKPETVIVIPTPLEIEGPTEVPATWTVTEPSCPEPIRGPVPV